MTILKKKNYLCVTGMNVYRLRQGFIKKVRNFPLKEGTPSYF